MILWRNQPKCTKSAHVVRISFQSSHPHQVLPGSPINVWNNHNSNPNRTNQPCCRRLRCDSTTRNRNRSRSALASAQIGTRPRQAILAQGACRRAEAASKSRPANTADMLCNRFDRARRPVVASKVDNICLMTQDFPHVALKCELRRPGNGSANAQSQTDRPGELTNNDEWLVAR